jgi:hypothetical protein
MEDLQAPKGYKKESRGAGAADSYGKVFVEEKSGLFFI